MPIVLTALLLLVLVACAADAYQVALAKEAEDRKDAQRLSSMGAAMTDETGRCWQCLDAVRVLELVDRGFRYELLCQPCATVAKAMMAPRPEAA